MNRERLPHGRRALSTANAAVVVATGAVAAFVPLAIEQLLLTSPRPDSWPAATVAGAASWAAFGAAAARRTRIRRDGGSLYYVSALSRSKSDQSIGSVAELEPHFLATHRIIRDLPDDTSDWRATADQLVEHLRMVYEGDDPSTSNALLLNCEWPVAWYLGARTTHHWPADVWERSRRDHYNAPRPAVSVPLPPSVDDTPGDLHATVTDDEAASQDVLISLEITRQLSPDAPFLHSLGAHRLVRINLADGDGNAVYGHTLGPADTPRLVEQVAEAVVSVMNAARRVTVIAGLPGSWPYVLGVTVNQRAAALPETRFAVWRQEYGTFALTDVVLGRPHAS